MDFGADSLAAAGVEEGWWAEKFARREDVSSVFDFSKNGRRITEGPPDMTLLDSLIVGFERIAIAVRGGEYELHGDGGSASGWISSDCDSLQEECGVRTGSSFLF